MKRRFLSACSVVLGVLSVVQPDLAERAQAPQARAQSIGLMPVESQTALVKQYCSGCHNDSVKSGGMTLTQLDLAHTDSNPELVEKVIRKLKTGLMPPSTVTKRPDVQTVKAFVATLETQMDRLASLRANPGSRPFQRL